MTDIVDRLKAYAECNNAMGAYTEEKCAYDAIDEIERLRKVESDLRSCFERVLLDIKFMTENDIIPDHILDDMIYQNSFELMTEEFMKEFNNE